MKILWAVDFEGRYTLYRSTFTASVSCASFSRDGQGLLVSTTDGKVRLLDKENGELLAE